MPRLPAYGAALVAVVTFAPLSDASAHCWIGGRFLPATLIVDDPCVADELSLPTVAYFHNGDIPSARELDISGEFSKRITDNFGVSIGSTWTRLSPPGGPNASGFQNLETSFMYQIAIDPVHEAIFSAALDIE